MSDKEYYALLSQLEDEGLDYRVVRDLIAAHYHRYFNFAASVQNLIDTIERRLREDDWKDSSKWEYIQQAIQKFNGEENSDDYIE